MLVDAILITTLAFLVHTFLMLRIRFREREVSPIRFYLFVIFYLSFYIIFLEGLYNFHWFATDLAMGMDPESSCWLLDLFGEFSLKRMEALFLGIFLTFLGLPSLYFGSLVLSSKIRVKRKVRKNPIILTFLIYMVFLILDFYFSFRIIEDETPCFLFFCGEYGRVYSWVVLFTWTSAPLFFYLFGYLFGVSGVVLTKKDLRKLFLLSYSIFFLGMYLWDRGQGPWRYYGNYLNEIPITSFLGRVLYMKNNIAMFLSVIFVWISYLLSFLSANSLFWNSLRKV